MTQEQIVQTTRIFFVEKLAFEPTQIYPEAELRRDLGISSVDAVAIAAFVQKSFGCSLVAPELKAIITLHDLYDYIQQHTDNR